MNKLLLVLLSLLSGVLFALGWPANGFPFLLFVAFIPLLFIEDYIYKHSERFNLLSIFFYVYPAFFTWNLLTTWWIKNATLFGAVMAVVFNALFMTFFFALFHYSRRVLFTERQGYFTLIVYWLAWEYLHLDWDLSWSWLNLGNGFANYTKWIQWYEYTGTFGGSLWILLLNIFLFFVLREFLKKEPSRIRIFACSGLAVVVFAIPSIISSWKYNHYQTRGKPVNVVIVQPNIDPYNEKYGGVPYDVQIHQMIELAKTKIIPETRFVLFPESAIQEANLWEEYLEESYSIDSLKKFLSEYPDLEVVIGASTYKMYFNESEKSYTARKFPDIDRWYDAYNAAFFLDTTRDIQIYHKSKLVPGVEKMPFTRLFKGSLEKFALDMGGIVGSLGVDAERKNFVSHKDTLKIATVICYESIYGDFVSEFVKKGANIIFIVTNDGWWGETPGHRQHFIYAPLRAIETRKPIARAANTGISAFIDQRGNIVQKTKYWEKDIISDTIYANSSLTFYVRYGDYLGRISMLCSILMVLITIVFSIIRRKGKIFID